MNAFTNAFEINLCAFIEMLMYCLICVDKSIIFIVCQMSFSNVFHCQRILSCPITINSRGKTIHDLLIHVLLEIHLQYQRFAFSYRSCAIHTTQLKSHSYFNRCYLYLPMMSSSNGNIFRVTGHLGGEFTGHWWIPHTKAGGAELWCFLWYVHKRLNKPS